MATQARKKQTAKQAVIDTAAVPYDRSAEEAVIAGVMLNPDAMADLFDILNENDFYVVRLRWMYSAYVNLWVNQIPIDPLTVGDYLEQQGQLKEMGGQAYITSLIAQTPMSYNLLDHARIVQRHSQRRLILSVGSDLAQIAYDKSLTDDQLETMFEEAIKQRPITGKSTLITGRDAAEQLRSVINSNVPTGVQIGLPVFDEVVGGIPKQAVTMLIADNSAGKTALLLQACEHLDMRGGRPLYITLEEPASRMVGRRVFSNTKIARSKLRNNSLTPGERQLLSNEIDAYIRLHSRIMFDQSARTVQQIRRSVRQSGAELVIVDDLLHVYGSDNIDSDAAKLMDTMAKLKDIAIDLNCAVVVIHHLAADEASKWWPGSGMTLTQNEPPSLDSITWSKNLRFTIDVWLALVPHFAADIKADVVEECLWLMKDKEGKRLEMIQVVYDKIEQWFYDNRTRSQMTYHPIAKPAQQPTAKVVGKP